MSVRSLYIQNASIPLERDNRIDSMRGIMLILITINHYGGWITDYTSQPCGFVSDAEGFIFLSGFVFSLVYGKYIGNFTTLVKKIIHRSFVVYRYHFLMVIGLPLITLFVPLAAERWKGMLSYFFTAPGKYIISSVILINQPSFIDILPMYSIFILFCWPMLVFLAKGWDVPAVIICVSFWILGQFFDPVTYLSTHFFLGSTPGIFNIFSWQIIFFMGIYFGFRKKFCIPMGILGKKIISIPLLIVFTVLLLIRYKLIPMDPDLIGRLSHRADLPWLRLLNTIAMFYLMYILSRAIPVSSKIPWADFLGKHSIQVFSFHIFSIYFLLIPFPFGIGNETYIRYGNPGYLLAMFLFVTSLSIPAYIHKMFLKNKATNKAKITS